MKKGIYYNYNHYTDIQALAEELSDDGSLNEIENDIEVEETNLEPMFQFDANSITDNLDEERMSEDGDEVDEIRELIKKHVDFTKVNELMPKLWYPNGKKYKITKQQLLGEL